MKTVILKTINLLFVLQCGLLVSLAQISTNEVPYGLAKSIAPARNIDLIFFKLIKQKT